MKSTPRELAERHFREHPLAKLTDDELYALQSVGEAVGPLLKQSTADEIYGLLDLVTREQGDRP